MDRADEIQEYWRAKAASLGEAISYRTIAQMYRGAEPERLGILFLTDKKLLFEYSLNPRRGILDAIFRRDSGQTGEETITIPRSELKTVGLVTTSLAKRWARRNPEPAELSRQIPARAPGFMTALLFGTCLAVCSEESFLAFNTPQNREWLQKLQKLQKLA
jgi:hypothetical protein